MNIKTSYEEFARDFVRFLLADRDSVQISKNMGFKFNIVKRWINGKRIIKWKEFLLFSDTIGLDTEKILSSSMAFIYLKKNDRDEVFSFLKNQFSHLTTKQLAAILATDISVLNKFINGKRAPSLPIILKMLSLREGYLEGFILEFCENRNHPWQHLTDLHKKKINLMLDHPGASSVFACIQLDEYKSLPAHSTAFISEKTRLSPIEVDKILKLMVYLEIIKFQNNKFEKILNRLNTNGATVEQMKLNFIFWHDRVTRMLQAPTQGFTKKRKFSNLLNFAVFPVSESALQKIHLLIYNCNSEILSILENDNNEPYVDIRVHLSSFLSTSEFETTI